MRWFVAITIWVIVTFAQAEWQQARAADDSQRPIIALATSPGMPIEYYMVAVFCLFGFLIVIMQFVLFYRKRDHVTAGDITRGFITTLVVIAVVALIGLGYNAIQIQPALALFGTIIGYVLGRTEIRSAPEHGSPHHSVGSSLPNQPQTEKEP